MSVAMIQMAVQNDILAEIDEEARAERQSRAELILHSIRMYLDRKASLRKLFSYGEHVASQAGFTEDDVMNEIKAYRREKYGK
jgi:metal-responsive CopG/Arc/MetJ family transcriptional regulator